jgi:N-acetylmuramoyl-L-alanine amidase
MLKNPASPRPHRQPKVRQLMPTEIIQSPSPNFDDRKRPIRFVVLHYTGMQSADGALRVLSDPLPQREAYLNEIPPNPLLVDGRPADPVLIPAPMNKVSSHYLVYEDGRIFQLVDEAKRAWHAGRGSWDGETDMNSCSIGIEIANGGHDFGLPDYPEGQVQSVMALVKAIMTRHGLDRQHVIGHSDLAPSRKPDPGEKFPWQRLADAGLSIWPKPGPEDGNQTVVFDTLGALDARLVAMQGSLSEIGYGVTNNGTYDATLKDIIRAFQRRFRQSKADGIIDVETLALIERVADILRVPA